MRAPMRLSTVLSIALLAAVCPAQCPSDWQQRGATAGTDLEVQVLESHQGDLVVGGDFTVAGSTSALGVARFDGMAWSPLGSGLTGPFGGAANVIELCSDGSDLYAGGQIVDAGGVAVSNIARWDGQGWSDLAGGVDSPVFSIASHGGDIYAGGYLRVAGGVPVSGIARWDGVSWSAVDTGVDGIVSSMVSYNGRLILGGNFQTAGGVPVNRLAAWNGVAFEPMGDGFDGVGVSCLDLHVHEGQLYAAGNFQSSGGTSLGLVARWDEVGRTWVALDTGLSGQVVRSLTTVGTSLVAGGEFTSAGGMPAAGVAVWDGVTWTPIATTVQAQRGFQAVATLGADLVVGGWIDSIDGVLVSNLGVWDGMSWGTPQPGITGGQVRGAASHEGDAYLFGDFQEWYGVPASGLVRWDGVSWAPLAQQLDRISGAPVDVSSLLSDQGSLVVAGNFDLAGGALVSGLAAWDGASWSDLGGGVAPSSRVNAMKTFGSQLIVAGRLQQVGGGVPVTNIASWNGTSWASLGDGLDSTVYGLTEHGGELIAAGYFAGSGATPLNHVAAWDGMAWRELGGGTDSGVDCVTIHDGRLIVGGYFENAGSVAGTAGVAAWNGVVWESLGGGLAAGSGGGIDGLLSYAGDLYVVGWFDTIGGVPARGFARWDGVQWNVVSDIDYALDITAAHRQIIVAGTREAGEEGAYGFAGWGGCLCPTFCGDTDGSGWIDILDSLQVAQFAAGMRAGAPDRACGDVDESGAVDVVDAMIIAQHAAGLSVQLVCPSP